MDRPIIPVAFDLQEYLVQDRELYEDFSKTVLGINCKSWIEVQNTLENIFSGNDISLNARKKMEKRFFSYADTNNCKRIIEVIDNQLNNNNES